MVEYHSGIQQLTTIMTKSEDWSVGVVNHFYIHVTSQIKIDIVRKLFTYKTNHERNP